LIEIHSFGNVGWNDRIIAEGFRDAIDLDGQGNRDSRAIEPPCQTDDSRSAPAMPEQNNLSVWCLIPETPLPSPAFRSRTIAQLTDKLRQRRGFRKDQNTHPSDILREGLGSLFTVSEPLKIGPAFACLPES
jgi:hypothetical protein